MKIYLDVVIIINFLLDFNILYITSNVLKRRTNFKRILLSSLFGEITLLFLFVKINTMLLFFIKVLICLLMCTISFSYNNLKYTVNNMSYVYMISTIYGGVLYLIKTNIDNNYLYVVLLIILLPLFTKEIMNYFKRIKTNYNYYYKIKINFDDNINIILNSFLDTGNKLIDPYTNKGIILVDINKIKKLVKIRSPIYVPYKSLNNNGIIECIKPYSIEIKDKIYTNYLIGLSNDKFNIDGIDCILNYKLLEDLT
ncbi:MAG: hypothetical protein E7158_04325 [Firmicutes bacterium]|nr:hypothetical protein [Bacillota bacterium]